MIPDVDYVTAKFRFFNKKYFKSSIPVPKIIVKEMAETEHGRATVYGRITYPTRGFDPSGRGELTISNRFDRDEVKIDSTIRHEMIHLWIWEVKRFIPIFEHGLFFYLKAREINRDGYRVAHRTER